MEQVALREELWARPNRLFQRLLCGETGGRVLAEAATCVTFACRCSRRSSRNATINITHGESRPRPLYSSKWVRGSGGEIECSSGVQQRGCHGPGVALHARRRRRHL